MKKGQYNYYNSKLVTSTAERLRTQYLEEIAVELKHGGYKFKELGFILVPEDMKKTWIKHEFEFEGKSRLFYSDNFYDLYDMVIATLK